MANKSTPPLAALVSTADDDEEMRASRQKYIDAQAKMLEALQARNEFFDPRHLAMARAFLQPTRSGRFGESLGNAMEAYGTADEAERRRNIEMAQIQAELAAQEVAGRQEAKKRSLMGSLYKQASPDEEFLLDPVNAQKLAALTGDPKYIQDLNTQQKQQRLKRLGQNIFKSVTVSGAEGEPDRTEVKFDPTAMMELVRQSGDPMNALKDYVGMVPQLRKSGMLSDLKGDEGTPFDAMIMMADSIGDQGPAIKQQAQRLANQYKKGMIDEDKANTMSQQMLNMATSLMDKQQGRAFQETMRVLTHNLAVGNQQIAQANQAIAGGHLALAQQNAADRAEARRKEQEGKLTDQQKIDYTKNVVPIVQEGVKASNALMQMTQLKDIVNKAPSGAFSGAMASSVGALFGTDENTALRNLSALSKGLIPLIPRLPGAASNLDAQNLESSIGKLQDIKLTNKQRRDLISEIEKGFQRLTDRADRVQSHWDATKTFDAKILAGERKPDQEKPQSFPIPSASDIQYGKQSSMREAFKRRFGKYPEEF
jgi:hypothetical protein